jgi:hypothetical protein
LALKGCQSPEKKIFLKDEEGLAPSHIKMEIVMKLSQQLARGN